LELWERHSLFLDRAFDHNPKDLLKTLSPMGTISGVKDIVEAVVYFTEVRRAHPESDTRLGV
jgi:hypothetical protein